jgi:hypothetical protein
MEHGRFIITIGMDGWMMGHLSSGLSPLTHAGRTQARTRARFVAGFLWRGAFASEPPND